jgi:DNA-binding LytR/AlgR family response regulator
MKVIIIDDDARSIDMLADKLKVFDGLQLAGTASNAIKGIGLLKEQQPDLLFLDVELPDMSGLEFLKEMNSIVTTPCRVVIYTAHNDYMLSAFRGKAFDFLLKPFETEELQKIISRFYLEVNSTASNATTAGSEDGLDAKDGEKLLLNVNANDFRVVNIKDVVLFQYNHDVRVWEVIVSGCDEPIRLKRMVNNESLLAISPRFVQVHQKYILNINYLMEVNDGVCRLYPPFSHIDYVKVGRTFRKQLMERFSVL